MGEWANDAAVKSECWKDAPTAVPAFIGYLKKTSIGLNAWTLIKGALVRSSANLDDPTHITANSRCTNGLNEGAGHEIAASFQRRTARADRADPHTDDRQPRRRAGYFSLATNT